ncbi:hypothetical protein CCHL11_08733 [Colletotrichum chlorophyti]|uniref:NmrA-like domain-containing protein n=1 Tax=Colletotrichum chlorophyti TaxID=708187 RepID=A0A1Q8RHB4_9PEZI|nr:hypothetical protein CCHL11_08733 [Colletotrichum chlorophyti]
MVKIAIAGASGKLALEVIDKLASSGKHEVIGLVRKDPASLPEFPGVAWVRTSYQDKAELVDLLKGVHTVISFIVAHQDPDAETSKRLIDASIEAGVKRFAPSEWATGTKLAEEIETLPWFANKLEVSKYLEDINKEKKVIEYTLFQVGAFTNYFVFPHQTAKYYPIEYGFFLDLERARGFLLEGSEDAEITLTAIEDIAEAVAGAVEYQGEWPVIGGISGETITIGEFVRLAEKIIEKPIKIDWLKLEDVKAGVLKTDLIPKIKFPGVPPEQQDHFTKLALAGVTITTARSVWAVTDEWNRLLPNFRPAGIESYVRKARAGK